MIVVEGYTDVIALHQAGMRNCVGIMGTALTEDQVGELARMAPKVVLALDADSAGQEAMLRAARVAAGRKLELRVVAMPEGADPAELVARDGRGAVFGRCSTARCRSCASGSSGRWRPGTCRAPRARTACWRRSARCWAGCRRARCARSWCGWWPGGWSCRSIWWRS